MSPDPQNVQLALLLWDLVRQGGAWGQHPLSRPLSQFRGPPNHRHRDPAHLSLGPPAPLGCQAWVTRRHSPCGQQGPLWLHTAHTGPNTQHPNVCTCAHSYTLTRKAWTHVCTHLPLRSQPGGGGWAVELDEPLPKPQSWHMGPLTRCRFPLLCPAQPPRATRAPCG